MYKLKKTITILLTTVVLWLITNILVFSTVFAATFAATTSVANNSPLGKWRSADDKTGKPKSIVEIIMVDNVLQGRIIELLNSSKINPLCEKCTGKKANQPIIGMIIIWGVTRQGDHWGKGKILDPKNGKKYNVKLSLAEEGRKLNVRGYIGTPVLGRTQVWERVNQ